ncbi:interferon gamma receptor 1 isoform X2 [Amphiprion ocellaris]|uniref:interferon gamma receptor 1 isoform X2 n=1 Tax=Amphiprion ocellaris TaxID=80972 RepID=UPI0024111AE5|nr:interferon gamma receptor 1 isoform X2 [Amphiprion ocellaris]
MLPDGAFTVLLLLVGGVSAVPVPPPRNVHVSCQNAKVSVSWDYSKQQPHTIFRINISGSSENWEVSRTTDHHFDLSHFVWKSEENYKDFLYVTVTAIQGDSQSEGVQSNSFSFNYLKTVDTQCSLDFPPVDVKEDESGATVSFPNPVHFYKELEQTVNPDAVPVFQYIVSSVKNHTAYIRQFEENCMERVDTCKLDVPFPDGVKKCVRLKGTLFDSNFVNQLVVRETAEICAHVSADQRTGLFTTCSNSWYRTSPHGSRRFPSHFYSEDHLLLLKLLTNVSAALKSALQNFLKTLKVSSAAGCFVELFQKTSLNHMEEPQDSRPNETIQKPN